MFSFYPQSVFFIIVRVCLCSVIAYFCVRKNISTLNQVQGFATECVKAAYFHKLSGQKRRLNTEKNKA